MKTSRIMSSCLVAATFILSACGEPTAQTGGTPLAIRTEQQAWQSPYSSGYAITSAHYRIFTTARAGMRSILPGFLEAAYDNYVALTSLDAPTNATPMPVYMLASRQEWAALTATVLGKNSPALNLSAGGFTHNGIGVYWDIGGTGVYAVAAHEGMHQFLHHNLQDTLPTWLEESLATQAEGYEMNARTVQFTPDRNPQRWISLRAAIIQDNWIPLKRLVTMLPADVAAKSNEKATDYYGQVWALGLMLRTDPELRPALLRLLTDAAAGKLHEAVGVPAGALQQLSANPQAYQQVLTEAILAKYLGDMASLSRRYDAFSRKLAKLN